MAEKVQPLLLRELPDSGFLLGLGLCYGQYGAHGLELRRLVGRFAGASKLADTIEFGPKLL